MEEEAGVGVGVGVNSSVGVNVNMGDGIGVMACAEVEATGCCVTRFEKKGVSIADLVEVARYTVVLVPNLNSGAKPV